MSNYTVTVKEHIAEVVYSRPKVNTFSYQDYWDGAHLFNSLSYQDDVYAIVFRTEGKWFSPGTDVNELKSGEAFDKIVKEQGISDLLHQKWFYREAFKAMLKAVYSCHKPVVTAIQGYCLGSGVGFAACSDVIVASDDAKFGIPEIKVGIPSGGGLLQMLVPDKVMRYMVLSGNFMTAEQIAQYGSIHKVVPREKLVEEAFAVAKEISRNAPVAVRSFKQAINTYTEQIDNIIWKFDLEAAYGQSILDHPDVLEAKAAFAEKREPHYGK